MKWVPFAIFLGIFLGISVSIYAIYRKVSHKIRHISTDLFGTANLMKAINQVNEQVYDRPRTISACENSVLPRILRDFPDFDLSLAKTYCRNYLKEQLTGHKNLTIHKVALFQYNSNSIQKTVIFQAAVSWDDGQKLQKRFDISYTNKPETDQGTIAANCPNCGAALGYGIRECPYCGSRLVNILENVWTFTELLET